MARADGGARCGVAHRKRSRLPSRAPLALDDVSWIRPGKSTEEWITSRLLYNVDFVSGLNTDTYRYYIDFAAEYGLST